MKKIFPKYRPFIFTSFIMQHSLVKISNIKYLLTCFLLFLSFFSFSQLWNTDSLLTLLNTDKEDTNKVNHLNALAISYIYKEPNKTIEYAEQSLILAEKINFKKGIGYANQWVSVVYLFQGDYSLAMDFTLKAEKIFLETGDEIGLKYCYTTIGTIYDFYGRFSGNVEDFNKAFIYCNKTLDIAKKYNQEISGGLENLGILYKDIGNLTHNIEDYNKAIALDPNLALAYSNRGIAYAKKGDIGRAISNLQKACDLGDEDGCKNLQKVLRMR